ncbi:serine O-acetyltransferase [Vaginella massiliensis]|uniref:serine O-acetyltransferase n=1 Tax=Vaginella massiliensis TaxID=1816680 RepID=UPI00083800A3|nr:serine acetyltransferase [Vaginella massiliensis]
MKTIIQKDFYRNFGYWTNAPLFKGFMSPGFRFIYFLRKAQQYPMKHPLGFFYRLLLRRYSIKYGYQISAKTEIGAGLHLGHWGHVVVNPKAKIGKNCNLAHGVTIGQTNRGESKGYPTLKDDVWVGTNAVIVGGITIGNNVLIAPNSYVTRDVPDNSIVVGNPMRIILNEKATEGYINNRID